MPKDYGQARQWLRKAADQGYAEAQRALGDAYSDDGLSFTGIKVVDIYRSVYFGAMPRDYPQAVQWYRKAAEQGDVDAQRGLADFYFSGDGVTENSVVAYALFNLVAAEEGALGGVVRRDTLDELEKKMTDKEIAAAQALSTEMNRPGNLLKALDAYLAGQRP